MQDALLAAGGHGNEESAAVLFSREHCEDDATPWMQAQGSLFRQDFIRQYMAVVTAKDYLPCINKPLQGLQWTCWKDYDPTHVYMLLMDLGGGGGGRSDDTSGQIYDATENAFIGELHGNKVDPYTAVTAGVEVLAHFGKGVFVLANARFPRIGDFVKNKLGYENMWKAPRRKDESVEHFWARASGFTESGTSQGEKEPSVEELLGRFRADFNNGAYRVLNPHLLRTMQNWNPEAQKHTPDRLAAARMRPLGLDLAYTLLPVTGRTLPERRTFRRAYHQHQQRTGSQVWGM